MMTMEEIYAMQRECQMRVAESKLRQLQFDQINSMIQTAVMLHVTQMHGLMLAGMFNPNFCRPEAP